MAKSILNSYHKTVTINTVGNEPSQNRNLVYNESLIDLQFNQHHTVVFGNVRQSIPIKSNFVDKKSLNEVETQLDVS